MSHGRHRWRRSTASDGTTTWNIFADAASVAGPVAGGGTGYLELFEIAPQTLVIAVGDTVHWTALGRHTVTFPALGQDPSTIDPGRPPRRPRPTTAPAGYVGPAQRRVGHAPAYTLTFPTAGTFSYVCLVHQFSGHVGTIEVSAATTRRPRCRCRGAGRVVRGAGSLTPVPASPTPGG